LKENSVLDQDIGRAVARQEGINLVLAGSIAPKGSGYTVTVRGVNPDDGRQLWSESADARSKADVLSAVGRVASEVRRQFGDETPRSKRLEYGNIMASRELGALKEYVVAQELFTAGKYEEAIEHYKRSTQEDKDFGRAYANWGLAANALRRSDEAEQKGKIALSLADRMTEREKYATYAAYYATIARNYPAAIDAYENLVKLSPADARAHNNLSIAYFRVRNFPKAMEEVGKAVKIYPRNVNRRVNFALYAMYAGDFDAAARQAEENAKEPSVSLLNFMPIAMAAMSRDNFAEAGGAYDQMMNTGEQGASLAATGLADMALYRGRYEDAQVILKTAIEADRAAKLTAGLSAKLIALAEAYEGNGQSALALKTVREALQLGREESILLPTALLLLRAGQTAEAEDIAAELDNQLQTQTRAYAKVIDGEAAARKRRRASAIDAFREAIKLGDPWLAHFKMGIAYVEADHPAEAITELEACLKRRGEVTAMFLDDTPTFRYMATLPYWLGRAQAGLGQNAQARANFESFLASRDGASNDPIVADARKRLAALK
jgi:tetratricopeptide (TPR) repeat protein